MCPLLIYHKEPETVEHGAQARFEGLETAGAATHRIAFEKGLTLFPTLRSCYTTTSLELWNPGRKPASRLPCPNTTPRSSDNSNTIPYM